MLLCGLYQCMERGRERNRGYQRAKDVHLLTEQQGAIQ